MQNTKNTKNANYYAETGYTTIHVFDSKKARDEWAAENDGSFVGGCTPLSAAEARHEFGDCCVCVVLHCDEGGVYEAHDWSSPLPEWMWAAFMGTKTRRSLWRPPDNREAAGGYVMEFGRCRQRRGGGRMNAATFRALRETCGMSRRTVAGALCVTEKAVQYWERGDRPVPPDVADWMTDRVRDHDAAVEESAEFALEGIEDAAGSAGPFEVAVSYYRTQAEYDAHGRDPGDVGIANARSRAIAAELRAEGYEVGFRYPADEPWMKASRPKG